MEPDGVLFRADSGDKKGLEISPALALALKGEKEKTRKSMEINGVRLD